jgi:hypothetical protein
MWVLRGCQTILDKDCVELSNRLFKQRRRPVRLPSTPHCAECELEITAQVPIELREGFIFFFLGVIWWRKQRLDYECDSVIL